MTVLTQTPSRAACFLAALVSLPDAAAIYEGTEPYDTLTNTSGSCENAKGPVDAALSTGFVNCSCIDPNDGDANATANFVTTQGKQAKAMFFDTMLQLAALNYSSVSCDARGYSPGASPADNSAYHYDKLAGDIISIVDQMGFAAKFGGKFHLVAHDQGARVSWHSIARGITRPRLLSFTSLSIPHSDVFSDALLSSHPDADQRLLTDAYRDLGKGRMHHLVAREKRLVSETLSRT